MREYLLELVRPHYEEPHRHYHAMHHIFGLLEQLEHLHRVEKVLPFGLRDLIALEVACIYHDLIYDPRSKTNEEDSAAFMARDMMGTLDAALIAQIQELILATKHHAFGNVVDNSPTGYLLDFDLRQLASDWNWFNRNSQDIRLEYSHLSDLEWVQGRKKFFESMATWPHIYHTSLYQSRYDEPAKANIAQAILELDKAEKALLT